MTASTPIDTSAAPRIPVHVCCTPTPRPGRDRVFSFFNLPSPSVSLAPETVGPPSLESVYFPFATPGFTFVGWGMRGSDGRPASHDHRQTMFDNRVQPHGQLFHSCVAPDERRRRRGS